MELVTGLQAVVIAQKVIMDTPVNIVSSQPRAGPDFCSTDAAFMPADVIG